MEDLRYPIGKWQPEGALDPERRRRLIAEIAAAPAALRRAVEGLVREQLDTPYRPGGWTVRQVIHHVPDSHLNAYVRVKLALTEETPTVKTYEEARWAELSDVRDVEPEVSLTLLEVLHRRWVALLEALPPEAFARPLRHPEIGDITVDDLVSMYAWHGRHHVAHVTSLRDREGWG